jgi:uncharacterized protein
MHTSENDVMNKCQLSPYRDFVRNYYMDKDTAHNFSHIERILGRLNILSEGMENSIHLDRLYFLACFHGLVKPISEDFAFCEQVRGFLLNLGWSELEIDEGLKSLTRHLAHPYTLEEKIIHDANYLDLLGALGIAKAFTTGGVRNQRIEESADIFEYQYLDKVEFQTPTGKRLAEEGRVYAKEFLNRLRREL